MITTLRCNKCARTIDKPSNKSGLDYFGRCFITDQCRGTLSIIGYKPNTIRGKSTSSSNYNDWIYTPQLYNYDQIIESDHWRIKHNLNCVPSVLVYSNGLPIYENYDKVLEDNRFVLNVIDNDNVELIFKNPIIGSVQCLAKHNHKNNGGIRDEFIQISVNGDVTVCVHQHRFDNNLGYVPDLLIINSLDINPIILSKQIKLLDNTNQTNWNDVSNVVMLGNIYNVNFFNIALQSYDTITKLEKVPDDSNCYLLLSNGNDKVLDKIVNLADLKFDNNYIKYNELFVSEKILKPFTYNRLI